MDCFGVSLEIYRVIKYYSSKYDILEFDQFQYLETFNCPKKSDQSRIYFSDCQDHLNLGDKNANRAEQF